MSRTAYPMAADLAARLIGIPGVTLALINSLQLQSKCDTARKNFERTTGRCFIPVQHTRPYRWTGNPNGFLSLNADLASVTSLTVGSTAYTQNTDYELWPLGADQDGDPFTMVRFLNRNLGIGQSISINGLWGMPTFEEDAWSAILDSACMLCVPELSVARSGGMSKRKEGDTEYTFGQSGAVPFEKEKTDWQKAIDEAETNYTKVAVGL